MLPKPSQYRDRFTTNVAGLNETYISDNKSISYVIIHIFEAQ
jgi:hypothetical protein